MRTLIIATALTFATGAVADTNGYAWFFSRASGKTEPPRQFAAAYVAAAKKCHLGAGENQDPKCMQKLGFHEYSWHGTNGKGRGWAFTDNQTNKDLTRGGKIFGCSEIDGDGKAWCAYFTNGVMPTTGWN